MCPEEDYDVPETKKQYVSAMLRSKLVNWKESASTK